MNFLFDPKINFSIKKRNRNRLNRTGGSKIWVWTEPNRTVGFLYLPLHEGLPAATLKRRTRSPSRLYVPDAAMGPAYRSTHAYLKTRNYRGALKCASPPLAGGHSDPHLRSWPADIPTRFFHKISIFRYRKIYFECLKPPQWPRDQNKKTKKN